MAHVQPEEGHTAIFWQLRGVYVKEEADGGFGGKGQGQWVEVISSLTLVQE